jgi:hypothetical protein
MQAEGTEVINFLLQYEFVPLCLHAMAVGSELSKTVSSQPYQSSPKITSPLILLSFSILSYVKFDRSTFLFSASISSKYNL